LLQAVSQLIASVFLCVAFSIELGRKSSYDEETEDGPRCILACDNIGSWEAKDARNGTSIALDEVDYVDGIKFG
jgi:hypothetical protein